MRDISIEGDGGEKKLLDLSVQGVQIVRQRVVFYFLVLSFFISFDLTGLVLDYDVDEVMLMWRKSVADYPEEGCCFLGSKCMITTVCMCEDCSVLY